MILLTVRIISFVMRLDLESIKIHCEIDEAKTRTKLSYRGSSDGVEMIQSSWIQLLQYYLRGSSIANNR